MSDVSSQARKQRARSRREAAKWIKRVLLGLGALGFAALIVVAFIPKPIPVDTAEVVRDRLQVTVDEDGRTRVIDRYLVRAPLSGNLGRIELHPGDTVESGQVLARIVPLARPLMDSQSRAEAEARVAASSAAVRQARASTDRARAALTFAESQHGRQQTLVQTGALSRETFERSELELRSRREEVASAEFGARVAAHQLNLARAALGRFDGGESSIDQLELSSPIDGSVLRVQRISGGVVTPGVELLELGDQSHLEIVVDVLTSDAVDIEPADRVIIERWGGDSPLEGHVRRIEPSAFTRTSALGVEEQRVNVLIDLDSPREEWVRLGDGFRVETRIVIWEEEDVLVAPESAVFRHDGGWAVYHLVDGVVRLISVETGRRNGLSVEITSGLEVGDIVVPHPSDRVADGVRAEPR